jgi:hypothetical protein
MSCCALDQWDGHQCTLPNYWQSSFGFIQLKYFHPIFMGVSFHIYPKVHAPPKCTDGLINRKKFITVYKFWKFAVKLLRMGCTLHSGLYLELSLDTWVSLLFRWSIIRMGINLLYVNWFHVTIWITGSVLCNPVCMTCTESTCIIAARNIIPCILTSFHWPWTVFGFKSPSSALIYFLVHISVCLSFNKSENFIVKKQIENVSWRTVLTNI